jgi:hypothetical protein
MGHEDQRAQSTPPILDEFANSFCAFVAHLRILTQRVKGLIRIGGHRWKRKARRVERPAPPARLHGYYRNVLGPKTRS